MLDDLAARDAEFFPRTEFPLAVLAHPGEHPAIVGTHWFQFYDQPTSGRFDGENYQTGLLDIADTPYAEVIAACRYMGHSLYQIRSVLAAQPTRKDGAER